MEKWLVLADGPSRNLPALEAGWPGTSIGVNRCCDPKHKVRFTPTYLMMNDMEACEEQYQYVRPLPAKNKWPYLVFYQGLPLCCTYTYDIDFDNSGKPGFAEEGPLNLYSLNTGCLAIQWAYQMGAREIGILGMDMYYPDGDSHGCGDLRGTGSTTDANFPRGIEWFEKADFPADLHMVLLFDDPLCPLNEFLEHEDFEEFAKGEG